MRKILLFVGAILASVSVANARDQIRIVGSSTVFPITQAVAEQWSNISGQPAPVVESTGTGGGFKIFCSGTGEDTPDLTGASRSIKDSESELCITNGVTPLELKIGYDGIAIAQSKDGLDLKVTKEQLFLALAAVVPIDNVLQDNPFRKWSDIDPALPDEEILVFGPPPTSGTRDAFVELVMDEGCKNFDVIQTLDAEAQKITCSRMRQDGLFVEAGENDNLIVQRLVSDEHAFGIFGFSFLYENQDTLVGVPVDDVAPSIDTIADGSYGVSRPLFIYVKKEHMGVIPGLEDFLNEYLSEDSLSESGYLVDRGLIPLNAEERETLRTGVTNG